MRRSYSLVLIFVLCLVTPLTATDPLPMNFPEFICRKLSLKTTTDLEDCIDTVNNVLINYGPVFGSNSGMINGSNTEIDDDNDNNNDNNNMFQLVNSSKNVIYYHNTHVNLNFNLNQPSGIKSEKSSAQQAVS